MIELEYLKYYDSKKHYKDKFVFIQPNVLIEAISEAISNTGLIITVEEAIKIELYKLNAIKELKSIINKIADDYSELQNMNGLFCFENLPNIKPVSYETQIYNVICQDIKHIQCIEYQNKTNIEKNFNCCGAIGNDETK